MFIIQRIKDNSIFGKLWLITNIVIPNKMRKEKKVVKIHSFNSMKMKVNSKTYPLPRKKLKIDFNNNFPLIFFHIIFQWFLFAKSLYFVIYIGFYMLDYWIILFNEFFLLFNFHSVMQKALRLLWFKVWIVEFCPFKSSIVIFILTANS